MQNTKYFMIYFHFLRHLFHILIRFARALATFSKTTFHPSLTCGEVPCTGRFRGIGACRNPSRSLHTAFTNGLVSRVHLSIRPITG